MPALISCTEGMEQIIVPLGKAVLLIGRDENAGVLLPHADISKEHASIVTINGNYVIRDNGSTNGTFVNEEKVSERILAHNDKIRFGPYHFRVDLESIESPDDFENEEVTCLDRGGQEYRRSLTVQKGKGTTASSPLKILMAGKVPTARASIVPPKSNSRTTWGLVGMSVAVMALAFMLYDGASKRSSLETQILKQSQTLDGLQKDIAAASEHSQDIESELEKTKEKIRALTEANGKLAEDLSKLQQPAAPTVDTNQIAAVPATPSESEQKTESSAPAQQAQPAKEVADTIPSTKETTNENTTTTQQPPIAQSVPASIEKPTVLNRQTPTATPAPTPCLPVQVSDFFKIEAITFIKKPPKDKIAVWTPTIIKKKPGPPIFNPCLEVKVSVSENTRSEKTYARAYFYGDDNKLRSSLKAPSKSGPMANSAPQFSVPVLYYKDKPNRFFFAIPEELEDTKWKALVVFGDKSEAQAKVYPSGISPFLFEYPEKTLVNDRSVKHVARKAAIDPLIEYVVKTRIPKLPQITLFLRPPKGVDNGEEIKGVIALCLLAGNIDVIKQEMQKEEMTGDYNGLFAFANKHHLAILAWGANSSLWARANYDNITKAQGKEVKTSFSVVANAWERGVLDLGEKYGIPTDSLMVTGFCGAAHLAHALCLAKPNRFLAIHIHIPGFFERPTPEAARVLWCVTTGELYGSYEYSLRFVADCKKLGYPIVYKAIVGLGHSGHPDAIAMELKFFEFALTQKILRDEYDKNMSSNIDRIKLEKSDKPVPWPEIFKNPPFYGDIINQQVYPADQVEMIPVGFRIPIPTKDIRDIWARSN